METPELVLFIIASASLFGALMTMLVASLKVKNAHIDYMRRRCLEFPPPPPKLGSPPEVVAAWDKRWEAYSKKYPV